MAQSSKRGATTALQARGGAMTPHGGSGERSVPEIKDDIEQTRDRLAGTVEQIADRVNPKNLAERAKASAKAQVIDPVTGEPRYDRIGVAGGAVLMLVSVRLVRFTLRRRSARRRRRRAARR